MRETAPLRPPHRPSLDRPRGHARLPARTSGAPLARARESEGDGAPNPAQLLVEFCGRVCYRSWEPGLNPNVTRVRTTSASTSATCWARSTAACSSTRATRSPSATSRASSRTSSSATAPARRSARRACATCGSPTSGSACPPPSSRSATRSISLVERLEEFQVTAAEALGLDEEGVPFAVKKEVTSALRRLAPIGLSTDIVWTANVRTLRHVDRDAHRPRGRGGAAPRLRPRRRDDARRGAGACSRTSRARATARGRRCTTRSEAARPPSAFAATLPARSTMASMYLNPDRGSVLFCVRMEVS